MRRIHLFFVSLVFFLALIAPCAQGQRTGTNAGDRSPVVEPSRRIEPQISGAWDVWISGAVTYSTDGRTIYQSYEPGAAMNRLEIAPDGRYRWGQHVGKLVEVLPWHHQPGRRYYRVTHAGGSEYDFYYADGDKLILLFGGVGGHASTGTRLEGSGLEHATTRATSTRGERVEVEWKGRWLPATVVEIADNRFRIHYDGYDNSWDEWVIPARIRKTGRSASQPPTTSGSREVSGGGSNSLDVEWRTGPPASASSLPGPNDHSRSASPGNPLGVDWVSGPPGSKSPAATPSLVTRYRCTDGSTVEASYNGKDSARIVYKGRSLEMKLAVSASGARYTGGGWEWWTKGLKEGRLTALPPGEDVAPPTGIACTADANGGK